MIKFVESREVLALLVGVREHTALALRSLKYSERDIEDLANVLCHAASFPEANLRILTQARCPRVAIPPPAQRTSAPSWTVC